MLLLLNGISPLVHQLLEFISGEHVVEDCEFGSRKPGEVSDLNVSNIEGEKELMVEDESSDPFVMVPSSELGNGGKVPELTPESIKFDGKRQELRLQAIAGDYQHFERFKTALSTANLTVKLGAQNSLGKQVIGSFIIVSKQKSTNSKGGS